VAACEQGDQRLVDHTLLAEDDAADFLADPGKMLDRDLDLANDIRLCITCLHASPPSGLAGSARMGNYIGESVKFDTRIRLNAIRPPEAAD
jgi:hypothetical protein